MNGLLAAKALLAFLSQLGTGLAVSFITPPSPPVRPAVRWPIPIRWIPGVEKLGDQIWAVAYLLGYADGAGAGLALGLVVGVLLGIVFSLVAFTFLAWIRSLNRRSYGP